MKSTEWELLYACAILERDATRFVAKAHTAKETMQARLAEFASEDDSVEKEALEEGLNNLNILLAQQVA